MHTLVGKRASGALASYGPEALRERVNCGEYCMWWRRCDSLKCLFCLCKGLWTNECELLATPAYKRCICVRQWKGPASVMGDGASACGMWCLGERAGAEQMQSVYLANQSCWSPTDMFTQELNMQIHPFLSDFGLSLTLLYCFFQFKWLYWHDCVQTIMLLMHLNKNKTIL